MDWLGDHLWTVWLGLAILLGVGEMVTLDLVLLMLAAGAVVGMVLALADVHVVVQVLGASATSVAMLALLRPSLVARLHSGPELSLGHGKLVGTQGLVTQRITGLQTGRVRLGGDVWSASPYDDTLVIEPGETVEVYEIRGATAFVHPLPRLDT